MSSSLLAALLVAAGAAVGAPLRYVTDLVVQFFYYTVLTWVRLTVNVAGSLILGLIAGSVAAGAPAWTYTLVGTGFCGALTTFSTFGFETVQLLEDGSIFEAVVYVGASLVVGLIAFMGAFALAASL